MFDQIPALKAADRVFLSTAASQERDRTKWRKALQDLVGDVAVRRLQYAAEGML